MHEHSFGWFGGMRVYENPHVPATVPTIQLSKVPSPSGVEVSAAFRANFDRWLLDTYGVKSVVYIINGSIFGNPGNVAVIRGLKSGDAG